MGSKYSSYSPESRTSSKDKGPKVHPVWRGVGFAFMILIPIMSYAMMRLLMEQNDLNGWVPLGPELMMKSTDFLYRFFPDPLLYVKIGLFLLSMLVFYVIFMFFTFFLNSLFGVSRKDDPFYVPPVRHTKVPPKRYRRY